MPYLRRHIPDEATPFRDAVIMQAGVVKCFKMAVGLKTDAPV